MHAFPMFIKTTGRRVIIVGGGEAAAQKARLIGKTDAQVVFASPQLNDEIATRVAAGRAEHYNGPLTADFFAGAAMVFVASECFAVDASAHALAKAAGCYVNVVDQPHLCDLTTPSLVDRDPVVIAIGTEGTAPVLARQIKSRLEAELPETLGGFAAFAGRCRAAVTKHVPRAKRRAFWAWAFGGKPLALWSTGDEDGAATLLEHAIAARGAPDDRDVGQVSYIEVPAEGRDLLTLRAQQRLQEADTIYHGAGITADVLELARRDAERVETHDLAHDTTQMRASAMAGDRIVLLGTANMTRRMQDLAMLHDTEGFTYEVVPCVQAPARPALVSGSAPIRRPAAVTALPRAGLRRMDRPEVIPARAR